MHQPYEKRDDEHIAEQHQVHHFCDIGISGVNLVRYVEHFWHADRIGDGRRLDEQDKGVVERWQAYAERQGQNHQYGNLKL